MEVENVGIDGLLVLKPNIFKDDRGYFFESYNIAAFRSFDIQEQFVQDNESFSIKGVLRGLHFQNPPFAQGKLVRVVAGKVLDVAVDLRKESPTYGQHFSIELSAENKVMFWIPPGFAHGFVSLEDGSIFSYKCTNVYNKDSEQCIRWDDETLNINWLVNHPIVSDKDKAGISFNELNSPF